MHAVLPCPDTPPEFQFRFDGRSPDLRVIALPTFPTFKASGISTSLSAYSCGGSLGLGSFRFYPGRTAPCSLFIPARLGARTITSSLAVQSFGSQED